METGVLDTDRNRVIPETVENRHWREYLDWVAAGNTPDPEDAPAPLTNEEQLRLTDREWLRMTEWFFQYLIQNGIIPLAEIPQDIKDLYQQRKTLRGQ